jgi:hypothetical protein
MLQILIGVTQLQSVTVSERGRSFTRVRHLLFCLMLTQAM